MNERRGKRSWKRVVSETIASPKHQFHMTLIVFAAAYVWNWPTSDAIWSWPIVVLGITIILAIPTSLLFEQVPAKEALGAFKAIAIAAVTRRTSSSSSSSEETTTTTQPEELP